MIKTLFLSILEGSVSVSLVVLALFLLAPLLNRRYAAKWKYGIWVILALRLLLPLNAEAPSRPVVVDIPAQITTPFTAGNMDPVQPTPDAGTELPVVAGEEAASVKPQTKAPSISLSLLDIAALLWLVGSLFLLFVSLFGYMYCRNQIVKKGTPIEDNHVLNLLQHVSRELGVKSRLSVMKYSEAASPMVLGFFHPILVLPEEVYDQKELYFVLKHEMVHLKRHDVYFKLLFAAANAVHWFNPVIWLMRKEAAVDIELSCDERVVQDADYAVRRAYTETLFSTLQRQFGKRTELSTHFYGGTRVMKKRFKNILQKTEKKNGVLLMVCAVLLTVVMGTVMGYSFAGYSMAGSLEGEDFPAQAGQPDPGAGDPLNLEARGLWAESAQNLFAEENVLRFATGLQIIFPEEWDGKIAAAVVSGEDTLVVSERTNMEAGVGGVLFYLSYYVYDPEWEMPYEIFAVDRVLGVYEAGSERYALVLSKPREMNYVEGDEEFKKAYEELYALVDQVQVQTEGMDGFTRCGIDDLDWIQYEGYSEKTDDARELEGMMTAFYRAFFAGDVNAVKQYLADPDYPWLDVYEDPEHADEIEIKGIKGLDMYLEADIHDTCELSLEFLLPDEDSLTYLSVTFVKEEAGWKVKGYGLEK